MLIFCWQIGKTKENCAAHYYSARSRTLNAVKDGNGVAFFKSVQIP